MHAQVSIFATFVLHVGNDGQRFFLSELIINSLTAYYIPTIYSSDAIEKSIQFIINMTKHSLTVIVLLFDLDYYIIHVGRYCNDALC